VRRAADPKPTRSRTPSCDRTYAAASATSSSLTRSSQQSPKSAGGRGVRSSAAGCSGVTTRGTNRGRGAVRPRAHGEAQLGGAGSLAASRLDDGEPIASCEPEDAIDDRQDLGLGVIRADVVGGRDEAADERQAARPRERNRVARAEKGEHGRPVAAGQEIGTLGAARRGLVERNPLEDVTTPATTRS